MDIPVNNMNAYDIYVGYIVYPITKSLAKVTEKFMNQFQVRHNLMMPI